MIALTLEPSPRRASTRGEDSSMRRPSDDSAHALVVGEARGRTDDVAAAFDVDGVRVDHHDFGDVRVGEQRLERPETERLIGHFSDQGAAIGTVRKLGFQAAHDATKRREYARSERRVIERHLVRRGEIEVRYQPLVDLAPELCVRVAGRDDRRSVLCSSRGRLSIHRHFEQPAHVQRVQAEQDRRAGWHVEPRSAQHGPRRHRAVARYVLDPQHAIDDADQRVPARHVVVVERYAAFRAAPDGKGADAVEALHAPRATLRLDHDFDAQGFALLSGADA